MTNKRTGFKRLRKAFGYSVKGIEQAWHNEEAFRLETILCICLFPLSFFVGNNITEYILLIGTLVLLVIAELFNSAIEALTDRVGLDNHELSGRAKDIASATVFIALIYLVSVWLSFAWNNILSSNFKLN